MQVHLYKYYKWKTVAKKKKNKKKPGHYALQILMQISVKLSFPHHELPNLNSATSADSW